jgi:flagellar motor switch protein FliG
MMMNMSSNLRKAAVLLRGVDGDTAAMLLGQLSAEEAAALREAMRELGPVDPDEQADVLAEFRREKPLVAEPADRGVELSLSATGEPIGASASKDLEDQQERRFEFLEGATASSLASYLAREHAQTIAVVLAQLPPERAATVLAALPEKIQGEAIDRLSNLGDTDSEAVAMLETELAAWVQARLGATDRSGRRRDRVSSILAAADPKTRDALAAKLSARDPELARRIRPVARERAPQPRQAVADRYRVIQSTAGRHEVNGQLGALLGTPSAAAESKRTRPRCPAPPQIAFDQLIHMDSRMLARLLEVADPNMLALALAGSGDELVDRICDQMPKRIAKAFRRELRRMGPTRLSDVEAAQRVIAELASQQIAVRRGGAIHSAQMLNT